MLLNFQGFFLHGKYFAKKDTNEVLALSTNEKCENIYCEKSLRKSQKRTIFISLELSFQIFLIFKINQKQVFVLISIYALGM